MYGAVDKKYGAVDTCCIIPLSLFHINFRFKLYKLQKMSEKNNILPRFLAKYPKLRKCQFIRHVNVILFSKSSAKSATIFATLSVILFNWYMSDKNIFT